MGKNKNTIIIRIFRKVQSFMKVEIHIKYKNFTFIIQYAIFFVNGKNKKFILFCVNIQNNDDLCNLYLHNDFNLYLKIV